MLVVRTRRWLLRWRFIEGRLSKAGCAVVVESASSSGGRRGLFVRTCDGPASARPTSSSKPPILPSSSRRAWSWTSVGDETVVKGTSVTRIVSVSLQS